MKCRRPVRRALALTAVAWAAAVCVSFGAMASAGDLRTGLAAESVPDAPTVSETSLARPFPETAEAKLRSVLRGLRTIRPLAARPVSAMLVGIPSDLPVMSRPGGHVRVGTMTSRSKYYRVPIVAWVLERTKDARYGRVPIPYTGNRATGWISLRGLARRFTPYSVVASLSHHRITVLKRGKVLMRFPAATGAPGSPTPPGRYFVTDRVPFSPRSALGAFAFGISGIQTHLPPGWSGGNQLAIHGTNNPASIGTSASAGCLRVSAAALDRLMPILQLGTPITILS
jgi:lipoprotein-anchoring transpeptidase ErfK/SrfK